MGNEWLIPASWLMLIPVLAAFVFLIRARKSRPYALVVLVLSILGGLELMQGNGGWDYWAIRFGVGFCFSAATLGVLASIVAGLVRFVSDLRGNKT